MTEHLPFAGVVVVDLSQGIAGPLATMMLAQYGATVIKVEPPGGDWLRAPAQLPGGNTGVTVSGNMGKRSICIDLKTEQGAAILRRLIVGASVFVESFRPGVIGRLGFGHDAVAALNPEIVYASVSGFGQTGPDAQRPAMDPVLQAYAGLMAEHGTFLDGPHRLITIPVDLTAALFTFSALSTALYGRQTHGQGTYLDLTLLQAAAWLDLHALHERLLHGGRLAPQPTIYGNYRTSDGEMFVAALNETEWARFRAALGDDERLVADRFRPYGALRAPEPHTGASAELRALVAELLLRRTTAEWVGRFTEHRIMCAPINDSLTFVREPHVEQLGLFAQLTQPGIDSPVPVPGLAGLPIREGSPRSVAPLAGADTAALLTEYGYSEAEIAALHDTGVVASFAEPVPAE
ncbi:CaiB/BaiF CoA transferase family protein [Pseudonocardia sp.]|jgi:crotonobetainyl-CoA:carnitine CoA-transferase CaiB-like acyl-CoA transferase|uniref:CaiB/BaiF CoA transferase family protein n=1 Tax=Pseudonocardia sp. TaxID=60912 RepID=UPI003D0CFB2E